jgi:hypothetical protein
MSEQDDMERYNEEQQAQYKHECQRMIQEIAEQQAEIERLRAYKASREAESDCYAIGDFVYYEEGHAIGMITDANRRDDGRMHYRIDYCQDKDLSTGPRGGNGPIWQEGYPQPVTEPQDVLFVAAMKERYRIADLKKALSEAVANFSALEKARELLA